GTNTLTQFPAKIQDSGFGGQGLATAAAGGGGGGVDDEEAGARLGTAEVDAQKDILVGGEFAQLGGGFGGVVHRNAVDAGDQHAARQLGVEGRTAGDDAGDQRPLDVVGNLVAVAQLRGEVAEADTEAHAGGLRGGVGVAGGLVLLLGGDAQGGGQGFVLSAADDAQLHLLAGLDRASGQLQVGAAGDRFAVEAVNDVADFEARLGAGGAGGDGADQRALGVGGHVEELGGFRGDVLN